MTEQIELQGEARPEGLADLGVEVASVDAVSFCARAGQTVASEIAMIFGPQQAETFDPILWASAGKIVEYDQDDSGEAAVMALTAYVLERSERDALITGETLFRKAGELGIHQLDATRWALQPEWICFAYTQFALIVTGLGREIRKHRVVAEALACAPASSELRLSESIFEQEAGIGDRDPELVKALQQAPVVTPEPSLGPVEGELPLGGSDDGEDSGVMSVGERPVKPS